jgi:hypothetical protein
MKTKSDFLSRIYFLKGLLIDLISSIILLLLFYFFLKASIKIIIILFIFTIFIFILWSLNLIYLLPYTNLNKYRFMYEIFSVLICIIVLITALKSNLKLLIILLPIKSILLSFYIFSENYVNQINKNGKTKRRKKWIYNSTRELIFFFYHIENNGNFIYI